MPDGMTLDMQSVQGTMLLPLWGRAKYSEENPDILDDQMAIRIIRNIGIDFSEIAKSFGEYGGLSYIIRARAFDNAVRLFIKTHPRATVVNIGAGLDTTFSRVDNGSILWYNLDLPDAIRYRQSLIPDSTRNTCISKSLFDVSWFDEIVFNKEDGILFISAGVLYYFKEEDIREIVLKMIQRFPGGELFFDAETKRAVAVSNKMVKKTGNKGAVMYFYINNEQKLRKWSPSIRKVSSEPFFKGIPRKKKWHFKTRFFMTMTDAVNMVKYVRIKF